MPSTSRDLRCGLFLAIHLGLSIGVAAPCSASTYHVSPAGDDTTGTGSGAAPWREIRKALTVVQPGDEILAADGAYLGFTVSDLGAIASPILIQAEGTNAEILPTTDRGGQFDPDNIAIWSSTNVVVDGFRSFGAKRAAVRIVASSQITIRNGVYGNNAIWAVATSHSDDVVVENCDLFGSRTQHGIYFANSGDRPIARGNRIHHNFGSGIRAYGDVTQGGDGLITGAVFEGNRIYGNYGGGGMNLNAFKDAVIRNNVFYDNHASSGIALFLGEGGIGVGDIAIEHNTIDVPADGKYNLRILSAQGPITLRNNVLYNRNPAKGLYSFGAPTDAASTDGDYDVVGGALYVSGDDEATRTTWADWRAAGHEPSSSTGVASALFADDSAGDYHLRPGSPAIDAGLTLPSVTVDLEGRPRPTGGASDVGAYEISGTAPAGCGDGVVDVGLGEQCDDGNQFDGDCCSATCRAEAAGGACATADVCLGPGSCDGAGSCATSAVPECDAVFPSGLLVVNEAVPGKESVLLKLGRAPAISQADLGDPRAYGGTRYAVCLYDDAETAVARLEVERGGDVCGRTSCWRATGTPPGGRGYRYKDAARDESGILLFSLSGGSAGKPKFLLKGKNDASAGQTGLPTGVAAALAASTTAKVRVFASDVARCWSAELDPLPGSSPALFRAER